MQVALSVVTQGSVLACIAVIGRWLEVPAKDQASGDIIGLVTGLVGAIIVLAVL